MARSAMLPGVVAELQADILELKELLILLDDGVLGPVRIWIRAERSRSSSTAPPADGR
jgi:hypothetical protein